jgi:MATE family multidrug resistance protein
MKKILSGTQFDKEIFRLAIPNIISNISTPLLSSVDVLLMGNLSARHLGAVGIGSMIFNVIYWNFGFLRMGTTGMTAQAYGAQNRESISKLLIQAAFIAICIAISLLLFAQPILSAFSWMMNVLPDQESMVASYFNIRLIAAPASLSIYVLNGWLFGMQNAWYPLIATVVVNIINIVVSYLLVVRFQMSVDGVAWGTVIAQYTGMIILIGLIIYKYRSYINFQNLSEQLRFKEMQRFLNINFDIFIRTVCLTFALGFFYSKSSEMGALTLAANLILFQFINWMSYGIDGFAFAAESLTGKYKGASSNNILALIDRILFWGLMLALFYSATFLLFGHNLVELFSNQSEVISKSNEFLVWTYLIPIFAFLSYMYDGIFIGLTASKAMKHSMFVALVLYLVCYFTFMAVNPSNHMLWLALLIFLLSRGLIQMWQLKKEGLEIK